MARCILAHALCFTFTALFAQSRRISNDNKVASADVLSQPQDTIFVNGFEYGTDEETLKHHFAVVGAIKDLHFQGRGSAVITYEKPKAATRAVNELHNTTLDGQSRYVEVKLDDPDRERKGDKAKGKGKDNGKTEDSGKPRVSRPSGRTIFVYGFEPKTDDDALTNHFGTVGGIESHNFISKVSAAIVYVKESATTEALKKLDGSIMSGQKRYMDVKLDNQAT